MSRKVSTGELEEMREAFEKVGEYNNSVEISHSNLGVKMMII